MRHNGWTWLRLAAGAAILAALVWRIGAGPFLTGLRSVDAGSLAAALAIGAITTTAAARRWRCVAEGLGIGLSLPDAIAASYRAQFLNATLPAGVLGDVHRALRHGREAGDVARAARAVMWERCAGQVVQVGMALAVLTALPSPARPAMVVAIPIAAVVAVAVVIAVRARPPRGASRAARAVRTISADVRIVTARERWPGIIGMSGLVVIGHCATFVIAVRTSGSAAPLATLLPISGLVLLAMTIPANVGGWGPREGVAAWLFATAGLGAANGIAAATVYGVMVLVSTLPGAVVLLAQRSTRPDRPATTQPAESRVPQEALHG